MDLYFFTHLLIKYLLQTGEEFTANNILPNY